MRERPETYCRDLDEDELAAEDDEEVARCMAGADAGAGRQWWW